MLHSKKYFFSQFPDIQQVLFIYIMFSTLIPKLEDMYEWTLIKTLKYLNLKLARMYWNTYTISEDLEL